MKWTVEVRDGLSDDVVPPGIKQVLEEGRRNGDVAFFRAVGFHDA